MNGFSETNDFVTHFNYIKCVNGMMTGIDLSIPLSKTATIDVNRVKKFIKLATLTRKGISSELAACNTQAEYAEIVAPWIAVKCYYRIYYLESVLVHLAQGSSGVFRNGGHALVRRVMNSYCLSGAVSSKLTEAEKVFTIEDVRAHKIKMGSNISPTYYLTQSCIKSVRAKVALYLEEHWKANEKITRYGSKVNNAKRDAFRKNQKISLFDFFYQMRLKSNYKDLDYLKFNEISAEQAVGYIKLYTSATQKYCSALETTIKTMLTSRGISL